MTSRASGVESGRDQVDAGQVPVGAEQIGARGSGRLLVVSRRSAVCASSTGTAGLGVPNMTGGHYSAQLQRAAFIMAALDAGVPLRDVQLADPRTTTTTTTVARTSTDTPPT